MTSIGESPGGDGPLAQGEWAERLRARVISPGEPARVHGYEIEEDVAHHYGLADYQLLCWTGELPSWEAARGFEIATMFLGPLSVAHASTHAAVLARLSGARDSGTIAVAATGLAEQARLLVTEHRALLAWLAKPTAELPAQYRAARREASVERIAQALGAVPLSVPALSLQPTRDAALIATLWAVGLRRPAPIAAAIVSARLPATLAEAFAERATNFGQYPIHLPRFEYRDPPPQSPSPTSETP